MPVKASTPTVSIVITCYNYGRYLEEAIDSCLRSTFQDFEIIVVNDGSTDPHTIAVLNQLNKPKTSVIHQENKGTAAARNAGIRQARGRYIFSLDADDVILPTLLEKEVAVLNSNPNVGFVTSWHRLFGKRNRIIRLRPYNFYRLLVSTSHVASNSLFRKAAWEQAGGYNEQMRIAAEDWDFWISLAKRGWLGYTIPEVLFLYRKHGPSRATQGRKYRNMVMRQLYRNHRDVYARLAQIKRRWLPGRKPARKPFRRPLRGRPRKRNNTGKLRTGSRRPLRTRRPLRFRANKPPRFRSVRRLRFSSQRRTVRRRR